MDPKSIFPVVLKFILSETIAGPLFVKDPPVKSPLNVVLAVVVIETSAISVPVPTAPIATVPVPAVKVIFSEDVPITPPVKSIAPPNVSVSILRLDPFAISTVPVPKVISSLDDVKVVVAPPVKSMFSPVAAV